MTSEHQPSIEAQALVRIDKNVRWLTILALVVAALTLAQATISLRSKSSIEQRLDILEGARRDQQKRNEGQDKWNDRFLDFIEKEEHSAKPRSQ